MTTDSEIRFSDWYANPLAKEQAQQLLESARARRSEYFKQGKSCARCAADEMIARFWLGQTSRFEWENWLGSEKDPALKAWATLVYGQLLMSRKQPEAMQYLQTGLQEAAGFLAADEYLVLMRRHELLSVLPAGSENTPPANLAELENEARVILRLKGRKDRVSVRIDRTDTTG